jgi:hypothetical protein
MVCLRGVIFGAASRESLAAVWVGNAGGIRLLGDHALHSSLSTTTGRQGGADLPRLHHCPVHSPSRLPRGASVSGSTRAALIWARGQDRKRLRVRIAKLEADLAYFQARLEIIGEPRTSNQRAQRRAFKLLYRALGDRIVRLKRRLVENDETNVL